MGWLDRIKRAFHDRLLEEVVEAFHLQQRFRTHDQPEDYPSVYWEGEYQGTCLWVERSSEYFFAHLGETVGDDEVFYVKRAPAGQEIDPEAGEHWLEEFVGDIGGIGRQFVVETFQAGRDYRELRDRAFVEGLPLLSRAVQGVEAHRRGLVLTLRTELPDAAVGIREIESDIRLAHAMFLALSS